MTRSTHIAKTARWQRWRDPYLWALLALATLYIVVFTRLAWEMHAGMRTHRSDLGQIDQAIWNSSRGRLLAQTDNGFEATRLTDHVEPILALISPIYWVWDDVRALLLLQVAAAAIGVLPLYVLALRQCEKLLAPRERRQIWRIEPVQQLARPLAFALGVAYLLAPQLQSALLTEFHAAPLAVPLILWVFLAVDARRWGQFVIAALLVATVKEEMALLAAGLGMWAMWRGWWEWRERNQAKVPSLSDLPPPTRSLRTPLIAGATVTILGLLWFYIATFVIVPAYAAEVYGVAESTYFQRYGALGNSSTDILKSIVTRPDLVLAIASEAPRTAYLVGLLVIFAWLPLLGIEIVLLSLPLLLANLLSAYPAQYYGEFHYSAPLVAYFGVAAAVGTGRIWRFAAQRLNRATPSFQYLAAQGTGTMAAAALVQNARTALLPLVTAGLVIWILAWSLGNTMYNGRGPFNGRHDPTPITAHHRLLERFTAQIPADAAVTATAGIHPHVSHRRYVYQFPLGLDAPTPNAERAQWALLDVTTNTDMAPGDLKSLVETMLAGDWGVVDAADGFLLMAHGQGDRTIPDAFYTFVRTAAAEPLPETPLHLAAIDVDDWPRWRQTRLTFEWIPGAGYDPAATAPWVEIKTPQEEVIATLNTAAPPALVWLPPEEWQPSDRIHVTTLPLHLPRTVTVRAAGSDRAPAAIFHRLPDGELVRLPDGLAVAADIGAVLAEAGLGPLLNVESEMHLAADAPAPLRVWVERRTAWPGDVLDLWIQWGVGAWPEQLSAFVHLRRNGETVAQADGVPRFWTNHADANAVDGAFLNDWRQIAIPPDLPSDGEWTLALGLYDPQSGARVPLTNGDELIAPLPAFSHAPPPDQSCALIPSTCASQ
jgi:uncharacterized membrane protein